MNKPHKHAECIKAWADGAEIELYADDIDGCRWVKSDTPQWAFGTKYRIKPKTIKIGKFDIPEPTRTKLAPGEKYWLPYPAGYSTTTSVTRIWSNIMFDEEMLLRGLIHTTEQAAIEHAHALISLTASGLTSYN